MTQRTAPEAGADEGTAKRGGNDAAPLDRAIDAFRSGSPVLVHDAEDREGETDLIYPADAVVPEAVARMRNDAGGLVCVALSAPVCEALSLPFVQEEIDHPTANGHDLAYDDRSSFSLTVNHRETRTGITDVDRSRTIRALSRAASEPDPETFARAFRAPGHVHLLRAADGLLEEREGHTEFGIALAEAAGLPPAAVVCEMLDDETGVALSPTDARAYADRYGLVYLEGRDVLDRLV